MGAVKWERLSALRTPLLVLAACAALCTGVSIGVFMIYEPAGWIVSGVLVAACLMFLAYAMEGSEDDGRAAAR
jgi:hypothetical protein